MYIEGDPPHKDQLIIHVRNKFVKSIPYDMITRIRTITTPQSSYILQSNEPIHLPELERKKEKKKNHPKQPPQIQAPPRSSWNLLSTGAGPASPPAALLL